MRSCRGTVLHEIAFFKSERSQEQLVDLSYDRQAVISAIAPDSSTRFVTELAPVVADIISIFFQRSLDFTNEQARAIASYVVRPG